MLNTCQEALKKGSTINIRPLIVPVDGDILVYMKNNQVITPYFSSKIQAIKTDNGSIFTNYYLGTNKRSDVNIKTPHGLDVFCTQNNIIHYLIDPGNPAQNGQVERSHREDEEKFYQKNVFTNPSTLRLKLRLWNDYYNDLEHCGLNGKTPNEMLKLKVPNVLS